MTEDDGSTSATDEPVVEPVETHDDTGLDLARSIARGLAGKTGPARGSRSRAKRTRATDVAYSGAHPDDRDPQTLDANLGRLVDE